MKKVIQTDESIFFPRRDFPSKFSFNVFCLLIAKRFSYYIYNDRLSSRKYLDILRYAVCFQRVHPIKVRDTPKNGRLTWKYAKIFSVFFIFDYWIIWRSYSYYVNKVPQIWYNPLEFFVIHRRNLHIQHLFLHISDIQSIAYEIVFRYFFETSLVHTFKSPFILKLRCGLSVE